MSSSWGIGVFLASINNGIFYYNRNIFMFILRLLGSHVEAYTRANRVVPFEVTNQLNWQFSYGV